MPIFDFKCRDCGFEWEDLIANTLGEDDRDIKCPQCGSIIKEYLTTGSTFRLKYDNTKDICDWQGNTSQYHRKDINFKDGPAGLL